MRRLVLPTLFVILLIGATAITLGASPAASSIGNNAPADEYFGKMKLSYLGINNSLKDAAIMAGDHTTFQVVISKIQFAEDALLDWQRKYPSDPQIARSLFLLSRAYQKVWTPDGQTRAVYYLFELRDKYPRTFFGKQAKANLSKGLTMHVYAAAQPCQPLIGQPTPTPAPAPTEDARNNIHVQIEPGPCFTPMPTPAGQPIPVPTFGVPGTPGPLSTPGGVTPTRGGMVPAPNTSPTAHATPAASATPVPAATATSSASPAASGQPTPTASPSPSPSPPRARLTRPLVRAPGGPFLVQHAHDHDVAIGPILIDVAA